LTPPSLQLICRVSKADKPSISKDPKSRLRIRLTMGYKVSTLSSIAHGLALYNDRVRCRVYLGDLALEYIGLCHLSLCRCCRCRCCCCRGCGLCCISGEDHCGEAYQCQYCDHANNF